MSVDSSLPPRLLCPGAGRSSAGGACAADLRGGGLWLLSGMQDAVPVSPADGLWTHRPTSMAPAVRTEQGAAPWSSALLTVTQGLEGSTEGPAPTDTRKQTQASALSLGPQN